MKKITIIRPYRKTETLRLCELTDFVELIIDNSFHDAVTELRRLFPMLKLKRLADGTMTGYDPVFLQLPRVCFASEMENHNHQRVKRGYTGMVLLEVNNLSNFEEAEAVRRGAAEIPQTLLSFVGASGRSVKIVCRGELFPANTSNELSEPPSLPVEAEQIRLFHENLYERARMAYNAQLGLTVEKLAPSLDRTCYISYDPNVVYNPMAIPFYARPEKPTQALSLVRPTKMEPLTNGTDESPYYSLHHIFEFNVTQAYDDCAGLEADDDYRHLLLTRLAIHCMQTGIPMAVAARLARYRMSLSAGDNLLVNKIFSNVYRPELVRRYQDSKRIRPLKNIPSETLLTMKVDIFLNANYELRKNVMRGVAEFRQRTGIGFSFRDLTEEARNTITMRALAQGIRCWDKDIRRYVNSEDIELYDPIEDYLDHLPKWDGHDCVEALARRIPTDYEEWPEMFHVWLRSMVAMWLGKGQLTGNALVPLLIGRQGCGKSSFCRVLLPRELREYYNDRINFKNESDLNLGLSAFALINLDEFDKITQRQQIVLKYLVSTADLKYRPPYGKTYTEHRRYASFIGTTNEPMPLTDPSGARRFVCVKVNGDIDFLSSIDYDQLYAQLLYEVNSGQPYWPSKEQEQELMKRNLQFRQVNGLAEMLMSIILKPMDDEEGQWMSLKEISLLLKKTFKTGYKEEVGTFRKIGIILNRPEYSFHSRHTVTGNEYWVKIRQ